MGRRKQGKNRVQQASDAGVTMSSKNDLYRHKKKGKAAILPMPAITGCFEPYRVEELTAARTILINSIKGARGPVWDPLKEKLGIFSDGHKSLCNDLPQSWLPQPVPFQKWCRPVVIQSVSGYKGISLPVCAQDGSSKVPQTAVPENSKKSKSKKLTSSGDVKIYLNDVFPDRAVKKAKCSKRRLALNEHNNGTAAADTHSRDVQPCLSKKKKKDSSDVAPLYCDLGIDVPPCMSKKKDTGDAVPLICDLNSSDRSKTAKVNNLGSPEGTELAKDRKFYKKTKVISMKHDLTS